MSSNSNVTSPNTDLTTVCYLPEAKDVGSFSNFGMCL